MSDVMNEKKVLALKYRPKRFEDLVGQSTISQTLSLALDSNRLSHAYLFSGLRGSGKTSTARIMAKALLCTNGPTSKPCEVCENCQSANTNRHLDIIEMDAASNRGIDDIKDLIEHTKYKPSSARFKVFIIDEVHMLTTQAFNALLKTLEEPPGFVKFILATTDPLKLPATILSRTQHFRFNKISNSDVIHHLAHILNEENINYETDALEILARSGQGSLRDTLTLLDQAIIFSKGKVDTISVVDMLGLIEPKVMDEIFDIVLSKQDITSLVKSLENYEISQVCDEMTIYLKQKMLDKDAKFDLLLFDRFFRILGDAKHLLALNSDASFVLILSLLKMQEATNLKSIQDIINQVEEIEVKPVIKEAVSVKKVVDHAHHDPQHLYDGAQGQEEVIEKPVVAKSLAYDTVSPIVQEQVSTPQVQPEPIVSQTAIEENTVQETSLTAVSPFETEENKTSVEELKSQIQNIEENFETKIEEPTALDEVLTSETIMPLDIVDSIPFVNPFDEGFDSQPIAESNLVNTPVQEVITSQVVETPAPIIETPEVLVQEPVVQVKEELLIQNTFKEEPSQIAPLEEAISEQLQKQKDPSEDMYELVINKVYDRDIRLGECFEQNFVYKSFIDNKLEIISYAQDDDRKFLFKHFGILKTFIYDIFGHDTELDFTKDESQENQKKKSEIKPKEKIEEPQESSPQTGSSIQNAVLEDVSEITQGGSGCVATMHNSSNATPAQQELQINDVLNSKMLDKAKELFDIKKITVKTKT